MTASGLLFFLLLLLLCLCLTLVLLLAFYIPSFYSGFWVLVQWVLSGLLYKHMARRWWIVLLQSVPFLHPLLEVTQFNISLEALKHYLSVRFLTFDDLFSCT